MSKDFQCPPQLRLDYAVADIHFRKRSFGGGRTGDRNSVLLAAGCDAKYSDG